jgi:hypothetical protein
MSGRYRLTVQDHDGEISSMSVYTPEDTAGDVTTLDGNLDTLYAAVDAVILGGIVSETRTYQQNEIGEAQPSGDPDAQREFKWLVQATDDVTGRAVNFTIPTADVDQAEAGTGLLDISAGAGLNLKNAIEGVVLSQNGQAISVNRIVLVERSL